jgi:hypothetical protein
VDAINKKRPSGGRVHRTTGSYSPDGWPHFTGQVVLAKRNMHRTGKLTRRSLPRIEQMLEWGIVKAGDIIVAKGHEYEGRLLANGNIFADNEEKSMQVWLKAIYGWSSIQTYVFAVHKRTGKTLSELREEYMKQEALEKQE